MKNVEKTPFASKDTLSEICVLNFIILWQFRSYSKNWYKILVSYKTILEIEISHILKIITHNFLEIWIL